MEKLKTCPFCGKAEAEVEREGTARQSCVVACGWCGCRLESGERGSGKDWNRRTPPPHTAAMIAWAKGRIAEIGELRRMDMVGFNELNELRMLEEFVGEWA